MTDAALLASRNRTATSAYVVSMWVIPGGHRYDQAYTINGFFEEAEKDLAKAIVARNNIPEMPILLTIAQHDETVAKTIKSLQNRLEVYGAEMGQHECQKVQNAIDDLRSENRAVAA